jgi:hypothetical protein
MIWRSAGSAIPLLLVATSGSRPNDRAGGGSTRAGARCHHGRRGTDHRCPSRLSLARIRPGATAWRHLLGHAPHLQEFGSGEHLLQAFVEAADAVHGFALGAGAAFSAAGLPAGLATGLAAGLAADLRAGFGACSRNPANTAGSSLANSFCTCGERSGRCTLPSVPPFPALPARRAASRSICSRAERSFCCEEVARAASSG